MKTLESINLDITQCKTDLVEFKKLLDGKSALSERNDVLPFFKAHQHLAALIGSYNPKINRFDRIASEFSLFGDYACDLVIGDSVSRHFCFVEFEDASPTHIAGDGETGCLLQCRSGDHRPHRRDVPSADQMAWIYFCLRGRRGVDSPVECRAYLDSGRSVIAMDRSNS